LQLNTLHRCRSPPRTPLLAEYKFSRGGRETTSACESGHRRRPEAIYLPCWDSRGAQASNSHDSGASFRYRCCCCCCSATAAPLLLRTAAWPSNHHARVSTPGQHSTMHTAAVPEPRCMPALHRCSPTIWTFAKMACVATRKATAPRGTYRNRDTVNSSRTACSTPLPNNLSPVRRNRSATHKQEWCFGAVSAGTRQWGATTCGGFTGQPAVFCGPSSRLPLGEGTLVPGDEMFFQNLHDSASMYGNGQDQPVRGAGGRANSKEAAGLCSFRFQTKETYSALRLPPGRLRGGAPLVEEPPSIRLAAFPSSFPLSPAAGTSSL